MHRQDPGTTSTGTWAWASTASLAEPSTLGASPSPRLPTTIRSAFSRVATRPIDIGRGTILVDHVDQDVAPFRLPLTNLSDDRTDIGTRPLTALLQEPTACTTTTRPPIALASRSAQSRAASDSADESTPTSTRSSSIDPTVPVDSCRTVGRPDEPPGGPSAAGCRDIERRSPCVHDPRAGTLGSPVMAPGMLPVMASRLRPVARHPIATIGWVAAAGWAWRNRHRLASFDCSPCLLRGG